MSTYERGSRTAPEMVGGTLSDSQPVKRSLSRPSTVTTDTIVSRNQLRYHNIYYCQYTHAQDSLECLTFHRHRSPTMQGLPTYLLAWQSTRPHSSRIHTRMFQHTPPVCDHCPNYSHTGFISLPSIYRSKEARGCLPRSAWDCQAGLRK